MNARRASSVRASFAARTPTLPPATHTNSYALGARDVLLVEPATPYEDEQRAWLAWARALPSSRSRAVGHRGHAPPRRSRGRRRCPRARARAAGVGARRDGLAHRDRRSRAASPTGTVIALAGPVAAALARPPHAGHAPGHVCLHDEDSGTLVVGDMVASVGTILIAPGDGDMRVYLEQLARLAALEARLALPAHGEPIDAPAALFQRYVAHRLQRERKVLAAVVRHGPRGPLLDELLAEVYDDVPVATWPIARLSLQAHLAKLEEEGRVQADVRGAEWPRYIAGA